MRVLLIIPTVYYKSYYPAFLSSQDFPVGFAYLTSALRDAGHDVFGLNLNNDVGYSSAFEMVKTRIEKTIYNIQPDIIGIGGLCIDYKFFKDSISIIRSAFSDIPIVCGGGIINNDTEFIFNLIRPDFAVVGEGEEALVALVDCIASGKSDYERIDNLAFWKDGQPCFTRRNFNYVDIDKLGFPYYEPFNLKEMIDNYSLSTRVLHRYPREKPRPMTIVTARSCPFQCTFCVHHRREVKYRARSVNNIVDEIGCMYEKYEFNILVIHDELFAVNKRRLDDFCEQLGDARQSNGWDFDWMFQTHASASLDADSLRKAKNRGCYFFSYGIESASPSVLKSMNKKSKPEQILSGIIAANEAGIGFGGNFIFGDPAETPETITESLEFFKAHALDNHVYLGVIHPYPGSKIFEYCTEQKIISDKLDYYEKIDERDFNMTSMPDRVWFPWVSALYDQARKDSWVKSTEAIRLLRSEDINEGKYLKESGLKIYRVQAKCPHCGKESVYSEPVKSVISGTIMKGPSPAEVTIGFRLKRAWGKTSSHDNYF